MVKKVKQKRKGNAPPEKVVLEKLVRLGGVLMWVLKNVFLGVKRVQTALGRSDGSNSKSLHLF